MTILYAHEIKMVDGSTFKIESNDTISQATQGDWIQFKDNDLLYKILKNNIIMTRTNTI